MRGATFIRSVLKSSGFKRAAGFTAASFATVAFVTPFVFAAEATPSITEEKKAGWREAMLQRYEDKIRSLSSPEKVFSVFASIERNGELFMTPTDFVRSLISFENPGESMIRKINHKDVDPRSLAVPQNLKAFSLFDVDGDGLISFDEYSFFLTILSIPLNNLKVAFTMFDLDGNQQLDKSEFEGVMRTLRAQTALGSLQRKNVDTVASDSVLSSFFGKDGKKTLDFHKFASFVGDLQSDILRLEFSEYDRHNSGRISARDFGRTLLSHINTVKHPEFIQRLDKLNSSTATVSFTEYLAFSQFLQNIEAVHLAIKMYSNAKGAVTGADLKRAAKAVAKVDLTPAQVDVLFALFDSDGNQQLDDAEFFDVLQKRSSHGLSEHRDVGFLRFGKCVVKCATKTA